MQSLILIADDRLFPERQIRKRSILAHWCRSPAEVWGRPGGGGMSLEDLTHS